MIRLLDILAQFLSGKLQEGKERLNCGNDSQVCLIPNAQELAQILQSLPNTQVCLVSQDQLTPAISEWVLIALQITFTPAGSWQQAIKDLLFLVRIEQLHPFTS